MAQGRGVVNRDAAGGTRTHVQAGPNGPARRATDIWLQQCGRWELSQRPHLPALFWPSRPVSRVLYPPKADGDHQSRMAVAHHLQRPTRGQAGPLSSSYLALLRVGFAQPAGLPAAGALLPHHFTLAPTIGRGGVFLWHFPSGHPAWELPSTLARWSSDFPPPGAKTEERSPGLLDHLYYIRTNPPPGWPGPGPGWPARRPGRFAAVEWRRPATRPVASAGP